MIPRAFIATLAAATLLLGGCGSSGSSPSPMTVVAFSDVHFDPFFDPLLLPELESRPVSEWPGIFAGSGHTGPGQYGHTTNYVLLQRSLAALRAQEPRPKLVIFGGDLLVQGFPSLYQALSGTQDEAALRAFALKTVTFVVHQIRDALGNTPVYFTLGNWDDYAGSFLLRPGDPFLADTAALFQDEFLLGTADAGGFDTTYRSGGYYAARVPGTSIVVLGLNTLFLSSQAPAGMDAAIQTELEWLDQTLSIVEASGKRAWLVMHVPPGGDLATTGQHLDAQGRITDPTMLLQAGPQERFLAVLDAHRAALGAAFTGHTHMDEYRLSVIPMQGLPGITAAFGNAPAFKTFTVSGSGVLQDYVTWSLDLSTPFASFLPYYDFSVAYDLPAPLGPSLEALFPELMSNPAAQSGYRDRYGAGHAPEQPITDLNWPVYGCGIAFLDAQGLTGCVNGE